MTYHYTYVIHKESTGEYYIGVRASKLPPNDDPYMGSSRILKERMRIEHDWFKYIIKEYPTRKEAALDEVEQLKGHFKQSWCVNRSPGGAHWNEIMMTPESRARISASRKGQRNSEAAKANYSLARKGVKQSPEHTANRIASMKRNRLLKLQQV